MRSVLCRASGASVIAILLALGLMAQASAQSVRDFAEIQATPVTITPDAGGRSAILEVDTSIDVACSVVYGTDETFGLIAVDSDMGGGAHAEHRPRLGGLEPDTAYVYRLQGTAPDGTIYVSEVLAFRTPPEPAGGPKNLALDATITGVSSEFSEAFAAGNAFDGDASTAWSSAGDGDDAWVEIDLGSTRGIDEMVFRTRSMSDGTAITRTWELTADGEAIGRFEADTTVRLELEARLLRFDVATSTGGNTGAVEILVLAYDEEAG